MDEARRRILTHAALWASASGLLAWAVLARGGPASPFVAPFLAALLLAVVGASSLHLLKPVLDASPFRAVSIVPAAGMTVLGLGTAVSIAIHDLALMIRAGQWAQPIALAVLWLAVVIPAGIFLARIWGASSTRQRKTALLSLLAFVPLLAAPAVGSEFPVVWIAIVFGELLVYYAAVTFVLGARRMAAAVCVAFAGAVASGILIVVWRGQLVPLRMNLTLGELGLAMAFIALWLFATPALAMLVNGRTSVALRAE